MLSVRSAQQNSERKRTLATGSARRLGPIRRAPSFEGRAPASDVSSRSKRANRNADTTPEMLLRRELSRLGLLYRANVDTLPGKPDIMFDDARILVFCDGDFWHGRHWPRLKRALACRANASYWIAKIEYNRTRDARTRRYLRRQGWLVVRLWESDIRTNPAATAESLKMTIDKLRPKSRVRAH